MRRDDFPGFDTAIRRFQDWDLWLTMSTQGKQGIWINQTLYKILLDGSRITISNWLPKFIYQIPWDKIGWKPKKVREYESFREVIRTKHHV